MTKKQEQNIILLLGALQGIGPFSTDMYLAAFPTIAQDLNVTIAEVAYSMSSYFVGICLGQLHNGPLVDRFGRRNPLLIMLGLYIIASIGCSMVNSVEGLILRGTFLARPQDLDWFFHPNGVAQQRPTAYADLCAALHLAPSQASTTALIDQLYTQLQQAAQNPVQAYQAALAIGSWNSVVMGLSALQPETDPTARQRRIGRELIFAHYCHHRFFLGDTGVLTGLETLADLPITLIHGNQDQVCPLAGAETLSRLLPHARLITVEAGHPLQAGAIREALRRVLDEWLHQATGSAPLSTTIHGDAGRVHEAQTIFF